MQALVRAGLPVVLALAVVAAAGPWLLDRITAHPYFAVADVAVRGARRLSADDVRAAAGIVPGTSIWEVDRAAAKDRLIAHPWIRSARVRRDLPQRVTIRVREQHPAAILALGATGSLWYVTARGELVAPLAAGDSRDFPFITGLGAPDFGAGVATGPRALRGALALVRAAGRPEHRLEAVSEVHVDRSGGLTLLLVRPAVPIEVGTGGFADKLGRLQRVLPLWAGHEADLTGVSLVFDDEVIVRTRTTQAAASARRTT